VRCYGVDYRTPLEHPYPAALDDGLAAYRYVLSRAEDDGPSASAISTPGG
jgi:acetyl esterase/lipase